MTTSNKYKIIILFSLIIILTNTTYAENITVSLASEEIVFDWSEDKCEYEDIPDSPAHAFIDKNGRVQLYALHHKAYRMIGNSLDSIERDCNPIFVSNQNSDPSKYIGYQWFNAPYTKDGETIFVAIHNEFQGHKVPGICNYNTYEECWYNSINFAISRDGGDSFIQKEDHLIASLPYVYDGSFGKPHGFFSPSNIITKDNYIYLFFRATDYKDQNRGTCLMRAPKSEKLDWKIWDGSDFTIDPINPYIEGDQPNKVCSPISNALPEGITYNEYLEKYISVGITAEHFPGRGVIRGFYYTLSDDLITWGKRQLIKETYFNSRPREDGLWEAYPSILDETKDSRNFDVTGQSPYLYFTRRNGNSDAFDRDLIRIQITFNKEEIEIQEEPKDSDNDGIIDEEDNCPNTSNASQDDKDKDDIGDVCDDDNDNDDVPDVRDNCPAKSNPRQEDSDGDGKGDVCDKDTDEEEDTDEDTETEEKEDTVDQDSQEETDQEESVDKEKVENILFKKEYIKYTIPLLIITLMIVLFYIIRNAKINSYNKKPK